MIFDINIMIMRIPRLLQNKITEQQLNQGKVIIIYGARRVGKTTLVKNIQEETKSKSLYINCDLEEDLNSLTSKSVQAQANVWKDNKLIIIDEAQRKKNIGLVLKIAIDNFPDKNFIITGSSSLELANEVVEPLTGRKFLNYLYPISIEELANLKNIESIRADINHYLLYGTYPETFQISETNKKQEHLLNLSNDYLYRDVLQYASIKKPEQLQKLLQLLAYQIGNEVSHHKLAQILGLDQQTVFKYIDLLIKSFVIFKLPAFSNNPRKEINTKEKIYFFDLGIRNAVINSFNEIRIRPDKGGLWENFVILERIKKLHYEGINLQNFFWRSYSKAEVDYIEKFHDERINAYEIKYSEKTTKAPKLWTETYPKSKWSLINTTNFEKICI